MGSIRPHGKKWRAQVWRGSKRASKVCTTKAKAAAWVLQIEAELAGDVLPDKTVGDAFKRYALEVAPGHRGARWEQVRLRSLQLDPLARLRLSVLLPSDLAGWRDTRLQSVAPATVLRELKLINSVFESCRRDWGWLRANPLKDVRRPTAPKGRARRISAEEVAALASAFGVADSLASRTQRERVGLAMLFAIETAMRSGEICGLTWADVELERQFVRLPVTKNGDAREVPLSLRAVEILKALPRGDGSVFGMTADVRAAVWNKHRPEALADVHFHDTRGEAIWRLSKRLDVLELAQMIGHRDPKSLMIYYRQHAEETAKKLG